MADSITWLINADASQVRAEMESSMRSVGTGTSKMVRDFEGVTSTHNSLLRSDHRVASSMRMVASEILNTGDAVGTLGALFEGLARSTNVGLGALIGLEIVGTIISKLTKAHEEAVKLNKELDKAAGPRDNKISIDEDIRRRREAIEKGRSDVEKKDEHANTWHWYDPTSWHWSAMLKAPPVRNARGVGAGKESNIEAQVPELYDKSWSKVMTVQKSSLDIEKEKLATAEKITAELEKQKEHEEAIAKGADSFKDKLQLSLAEIAKEGLHKRDSGAFDNTKQYAGDIAEKAMAEQQAARKAMLKGHFDEAMDHQAVAEQLKAQIPALKDSEKMDAFKGALATTEQTLREIRDKVSFANR